MGVLVCAERFATLAVVIALGCISARPAWAEEVTMAAFLVWDGEGHVVGTAPNIATFTGTLAGTLYVQTDQGPVEAGIMACPLVMDVGIEDGSQHGQGRCTLIANDKKENVAYSELSCSGVYTLGCRGHYKFIAGTGRFKGITGGGDVVLRSDQKQFAVGEATAATRARGIMYWHELHYTLP